MRWFVVGLCLVLFASARVTAAEGLRAGLAEVEITPPLGFPMAGYYHERLATGTRDPLKVKALVLRDREQAAALVACDLTGIAFDLTSEVRRRAAQDPRISVPPEHIILTATHSHTAPDYTKDLYDYLRPEKPSAAAPRYAPQLIAAILRALGDAADAARVVQVETVSAAQKTPVSFNRRFVMKDGSVRTWMNLANPDVVRPAGPVDPELAVVLLRAAGETEPRPLGLLTNFALHLDTVGGTMWSADYPYLLEQATHRLLGDETVFLFALGCCGDINHSDPSRTERNSTQVIGQSLAATLEQSLLRAEALYSTKFRASRAVVPLPLQTVAAEQVSRATQLLPAARAGESIAFFDLVEAHKSLMLDAFQRKSPRADTAQFISWGLTHQWAGVGAHLPVEVHVLAIGDELAIVCLPGEIFVELGLAIKQASPFRTTLVVELSNCVETAYVPTRVAYAGGGYEVANSMVQAGSGEMLVETAVRLLREATGETGEE